MGEQWCPYCQEQMTYKDGAYSCPSCDYTIDDYDLAFDPGYPTLESTNEFQDNVMEETFEEYYGSKKPYDPHDDPDFEFYNL